MSDKIKLSPHLKELSVLYVEDEVEIREVFNRMLHKKVKKLYVANNGKDGFEQYQKYSPDIIVSDINMPLLNGIDMIRKIRAIDKDVKILITTAHGDSSYLLESIDLHVNGYVLKPVDKYKLNGMLNDVAKAILYEREQSRRIRLVENIINLQDNMVLVSDGYRLELVNQPFLSFFSVGSLEEFNQKHSSFVELFEKEGKFHAQMLEKKDSFIHALLALASMDRVVSIKNKEGELRSFIVKINTLIEKDYIVTLTDITDISMHNVRLEKEATHDSLTGVYNRKKFDDTLAYELDKCARYDEVFSLIMFDIDFFKKVNDTYGHLFGDMVLKKIAQEVKERLRHSDVFARWGGEEFVIFLPLANSDQAFEVANFLRQKIQELVFDEDVKVTCSFGVAEFNKHLEKEQLLHLADEALYLAKNKGRNCVEVAKV